MRSTRHRRGIRTAAAAAAAAALALIASAPSALVAAGGSGEQAAAAATVNTVRFFAAVTSPAWPDDPRLDEIRRRLTTRRDSSAEAEDRDGPPALALEWIELPARSSDVLTADGRLSLRVVNLGPFSSTAVATVFGDGGSQSSRTKSVAVTFNLPATAIQAVAVRAVPGPATSWAFSGAMNVHVRACPTDPAIASRCRSAVSAPVYFHPASSQMVRFYREQALVSRYRAGDLLGTSIVPPGPGTRRVMGGPPLTVDRASDRAIREER